MSIFTGKNWPAHAGDAGDRNASCVMSIFTGKNWPAHAGDAGDRNASCVMSIFTGKTGPHMPVTLATGTQVA